MDRGWALAPTGCVTSLVLFISNDRRSRGYRTIFGRGRDHPLNQCDEWPLPQASCKGTCLQSIPASAAFVVLFSLPFPSLPSPLLSCLLSTPIAPNVCLETAARISPTTPSPPWAVLILLSSNQSSTSLAAGPASLFTLYIAAECPPLLRLGLPIPI